MIQGILPYLVFQYIVDKDLTPQDGSEAVKLPPMDGLAKELGVSLGKLREELIAARTFGVVDMRPGDGTYVRPYDFYSAIRPFVLYGTACDWRNFDHLYRLRVQLEGAFWEEAVRALDKEDKQELRDILDRAEGRLRGTPVEIPHREHRDFHLRIFDKLENQFVHGLLRAYWDAYEAVGLHRYFDYSYYEGMWKKHRGMVEAIEAGEYAKGKEILIAHFTLLRNRLQRGIER